MKRRKRISSILLTTVMLVQLFAVSAAADVTDAAVPADDEVLTEWEDFAEEIATEPDGIAVEELSETGDEIGSVSEKIASDEEDAADEADTEPVPDRSEIGTADPLGSSPAVVTFRNKSLINPTTPTATTYWKANEAHDDIVEATEEDAELIFEPSQTDNWPAMLTMKSFVFEGDSNCSEADCESRKLEFAGYLWGDVYFNVYPCIYSSVPLLIMPYGENSITYHTEGTENLCGLYGLDSISLAGRRTDSLNLTVADDTSVGAEKNLYLGMAAAGIYVMDCHLNVEVTSKEPESEDVKRNLIGLFSDRGVSFYDVQGNISIGDAEAAEGIEICSNVTRAENDKTFLNLDDSKVNIYSETTGSYEAILLKDYHNKSEISLQEGAELSVTFKEDLIKKSGRTIRYENGTPGNAELIVREGCTLTVEAQDVRHTGGYHVAMHLKNVNANIAGTMNLHAGPTTPEGTTNKESYGLELVAAAELHVNGGTVTATGGDQADGTIGAKSYGISMSGDCQVEINGGELSAAGGVMDPNDDCISYGILKKSAGDGTIQVTDGVFTAAGSSAAVNAAGLENETVLDVKTDSVMKWSSLRSGENPSADTVGEFTVDNTWLAETQPKYLHFEPAAIAPLGELIIAGINLNGIRPLKKSYWKVDKSNEVLNELVAADSADDAQLIFTPASGSEPATILLKDFVFTGKTNTSTPSRQLGFRGGSVEPTEMIAPFICSDIPFRIIAEGENIITCGVSNSENVVGLFCTDSVMITGADENSSLDLIVKDTRYSVSGTNTFHHIGIAAEYLNVTDCLLNVDVSVNMPRDSWYWRRKLIGVLLNRGASFTGEQTKVNLRLGDAENGFGLNICDKQSDFEKVELLISGAEVNVICNAPYYASPVYINLSYHDSEVRISDGGKLLITYPDNLVRHQTRAGFEYTKDSSLQANLIIEEGCSLVVDASNVVTETSELAMQIGGAKVTVKGTLEVHAGACRNADSTSTGLALTSAEVVIDGGKVIATAADQDDDPDSGTGSADSTGIEIGTESVIKIKGGGELEASGGTVSTENPYNRSCGMNRNNTAFVEVSDGKLTLSGEISAMQRNDPEEVTTTALKVTAPSLLRWSTSQDGTNPTEETASKFTKTCAWFDGKKYVHVETTGSGASGAGKIVFVDAEGNDCETFEAAYTGSAIKPQIRVYDNGVLLSDQRDYTVSYGKKNTNAYLLGPDDDGFDRVKAPSVTVKMKGNYASTRTVYFTIQKANIADAQGSDLSAAAGNKAQTPAVALTYCGKKLKSGASKDFTLSYKKDGVSVDQCKDPGVYEVIVTATEKNFTGTKTLHFTIAEKTVVPVSKLKISLDKKSYPYTGSQVRPKVTVKDPKKKKLSEETDYTLTYGENISVGTGTVTVTGSGERFAGSRTISFPINGTAMTKVSVLNAATAGDPKPKKYVPANLTYNGYEQTQEAGYLLRYTTGKGAKAVSRDLTEGEDYFVSYRSNQNAGKAKMIFTGNPAKGYTGSVTITFKILPLSLKDDRISSEDEIMAKFSKGGAMPVPWVKFGESALTEGVDFTLSYRNNTKPTERIPLVTAIPADGKVALAKIPTIYVKGTGNFKDTIEIGFGIEPPALDCGEVFIVAPDVVYKNAKNNYKQKVKLIDISGKELTQGARKDYTLKFYRNSVAEENLLKDKDKVDKDTTIIVVATAGTGGNYSGSTLSASYKVTDAANFRKLSGASIRVSAKEHTGSAVTLSADDIKVTFGKKKNLVAIPLVTDDSADGYRIVSYYNNVKRGTAVVILKGCGSVSGLRAVKFTIGKRSIRSILEGLF
ncbi:MAG: hypothetical protein K6F53_10560 [Lachnospiraceae bacterium]|nr:hypothetical protein [Lachnospiraceae bacterium]